MVDIEEETPDQINQEIDFGDKTNDEDKKNDENEQEIMSSILKSDIPSEEWKREVERISKNLKLDYNNFNLFNSEWRGHVEGIKKHEVNISKSIPDCRSILENLSQDIDRSLEKISKKEAIISKNFINIVRNSIFLYFLIFFHFFLLYFFFPYFFLIYIYLQISDYKGRQKETTDQLEEYNQIRDRVEKLQKDYDIIDDKIVENTSKFESMSKAVSDTSSVTNIKTAITNMNVKIYCIIYQYLD